MNFYKTSHKYYCGIDLHTQTMFVVITGQKGKVLLEKDMAANPDSLKKAVSKYKKDIVVGVECIFSWYWISDWCHENGVNFVLGHALYMKAIHGGKTKNDKIDATKIAGLLRAGMFPLAYAYPKENRAIRDLLRRRMGMVRKRAQLLAHIKILAHQENNPVGTVKLIHKKNREILSARFSDRFRQVSCDTNLSLVSGYDKAIYKLEHTALVAARKSRPKQINLLLSIPGIGRILSMVILMEIGDIQRFPTVQKFASYARLVKCSRESAGKTLAGGGHKIGNAYLKWAFAESACLLIRCSNRAKKFMQRMEQKHGKSKAITLLSHKIGKSVYIMLKKQRVFDEAKCFGF
jgi:transposase